MRDARGRDTQRKHSLVLAALEAAVQAGLDPTIAAICRPPSRGRPQVHLRPSRSASRDRTVSGGHRDLRFSPQTERLPSDERDFRCGTFAAHRAVVGIT